MTDTSATTDPATEEPPDTDRLREFAIARHEWVTDQLKQLRADKETLRKRIKALVEEEVITARAVRQSKLHPRK